MTTTADPTDVERRIAYRLGACLAREGKRLDLKRIPFTRDQRVLRMRYVLGYVRAGGGEVVFGRWSAARAGLRRRWRRAWVGREAA